MNAKILCLITLCAFAPAEAKDDLILNYSFDNVETEYVLFKGERGVVNDSSTNNNDANNFYGSSALNRNSEANSSIRFDGEFSMLWLYEQNNSLDYSNNYSVSFWGKFEDMLETQVVYTEDHQKDDSYFTNPSLLLVGGELQFGFNKKLKTKVKVPNLDWNHYVISVDINAKNVKFYINGKLESMNMFTDSKFNDLSYEHTIHFGLLESFHVYYVPLKGYLDDFKIYKKSLSNADVVGMSDLPSIGDNPCKVHLDKIVELEKKIEILKSSILDKTNRLDSLLPIVSELRLEISDLKSGQEQDQELIVLLNNELTKNNQSPNSTFVNGWVYDPVVGWLWTNNSVYPMVYKSDSNAWHYYKVGTSNPRLFYSYDSEEWQSWDE